MDNREFEEALSSIPSANQEKFLSDLLNLWAYAQEDNYDKVKITKNTDI